MIKDSFGLCSPGNNPCSGDCPVQNRYDRQEVGTAFLANSAQELQAKWVKFQTALTDSLFYETTSDTDISVSQNRLSELDLPSFNANDILETDTKIARYRDQQEANERKLYEIQQSRLMVSEACHGPKVVDLGVITIRRCTSSDVPLFKRVSISDA